MLICLLIDLCLQTMFVVKKQVGTVVISRVVTRCIFKYNKNTFYWSGPVGFDLDFY